MADGLQVVTAGLFYSFVSSNRCITRCSSQILTIFVGNMFTFSILVTFSESEIDDVNRIFGSFSSSDEEVIGLDISVDYSFFVDLLNARYHLNRN